MLLHYLPVRVEKTKDGAVNNTITLCTVCLLQLWEFDISQTQTQEGCDLLFFFFFVFLPFLGLLPWHMEIPRLGVQSEL